MRVVLNARADDAATRVCIDGLGERLRERGIDAVVGDWDGYARYDVAVFMGYEDDSARARQQNRSLRVILADPKQSRPEWIEAAKRADGLLVSSVEQRDAFLRLNRNVVVFPMFPPMRALERQHVEHEPLVVAYHGNRIHLESMVDSVKPALEALASTRAVELWAIYNVRDLGRAKLGVPDPALVRTRHIQWSDEREPGTQVSKTLYEELPKADVGIVPNALPVRNLAATAYDEPELFYEPFDHLLRFKASANAGRIYPFARLGLPVVTDFAPSAAQLVVDGESGLLASSPHGWFDALDRLAASPELRGRLARGLRAAVDREYEAELERFLEMCAGPRLPGPPSIGRVASAESDLAGLAAYARPRPVNRWRAALARRARGLGL